MMDEKFWFDAAVWVLSLWVVYRGGYWRGVAADTEDTGWEDEARWHRRRWAKQDRRYYLMPKPPSPAANVDDTVRTNKFGEEIDDDE